MSDNKSKADVGTNASETLEGTDKADVMHGQGGQDTIEGGAGADTLYGGTGFDRLEGGAGADTLYGGTDSDRLEGGAGDDTLIGGSDGYADTFVYNVRSGDQDVIKDFGNGNDRIALDLQNYNLSNMKVEQVQSGGKASTELDFGNGNTLTIEGQTPEQLGDLTHRFVDAKTNQSLKSKIGDAFEDKADVGTYKSETLEGTDKEVLTEEDDSGQQTSTDNFMGVITETGKLTLNDDGSGSWVSGDGSQETKWASSGDGKYKSLSEEGEWHFGQLESVAVDSETGTVTFTDDMGATGTITSDGVLNLQFSNEDVSDGNGSELGDIFSSAGLGNSDGDSGDEGTPTDAADQTFNELESEVAAGEAGSDGGTDASEGETSTDPDPVDEGQSDDEWPKVPPPED